MSLSCVLGMHDIIWNNSGPSYSKNHGGKLEILTAMSAARIAAVSATATGTSQASSGANGKVYQNGNTDQALTTSTTSNNEMGFLYPGNGVVTSGYVVDASNDPSYRGQWSIGENVVTSEGMKVSEIDGKFQTLNLNEENKDQQTFQEIIPSAKKLWDNNADGEKLQASKGIFFQDQWQENAGWGNAESNDASKSEHAISNPIMMKQRPSQSGYNGPEGMVSPRSADGNLGVCMVEYVLASSPGGTDLESRMKSINGDMIERTDPDLDRVVEQPRNEIGYDDDNRLKRAASDGALHIDHQQQVPASAPVSVDDESAMFSRTPGSRQPSPNPSTQQNQDSMIMLGGGQQTVNSSKTGSTTSIASDEQVVSPVHFAATSANENISLGIESLPYNFAGVPQNMNNMANPNFAVTSEQLNQIPQSQHQAMMQQAQQQQHQQQQAQQQQPQILYSPAQQQPVGVTLTSNPYFVTNPGNQDPYGNNGMPVLNANNQQAVMHPQYATPYGIQSWMYANGNNNPFLQQSGALQQSQQLSHSPTNTGRPGENMNLGQQVNNQGYQVIQGPLSIPAGATFYDQQGNPVIINGRVAAPLTNQLGQQVRMVSPMMLNTGTPSNGQNPALQLFGQSQQQQQQQQQAQQVSQQQRQPAPLNLGYLSGGVNQVGASSGVSGMAVQNGGQVGVIGGHLQSSNGASMPTNPGVRDQLGPLDPKRQMFPGGMGSFNSLTVNTPLANTLHVEDLNTSPLHNQQSFNIGSPVNSSRLSAYMNLMNSSDRKFRGSSGVGNNMPPSGPGFATSPGTPTSGMYRRQGRDSTRSRLLEDFRNNRYPNLQLRDLASHIVEFSQDQHGSRFIQQKLERATAIEKTFVFNEIHGSAYNLMTDVFGNYVIQKFFEFGSAEQKLLLAQRIKGHVLLLALQMYGCRVIQKALESIPHGIQNELVRELDGHVLKCVKDQNGNHVVQKCIECVDAQHLQFIIDAFRGQVFALSTHPYGCRVIQRILEHCSPDQTTMILNELHDNTSRLVQDQYGNYVIQHVLEHGSPEEKTKIINIVRGNVSVLSQHKFASNVVEKCVSYASRPEKTFLIDEVLNYSDGLHGALYTMMKDQYANYVVQRMIDVAEPMQRKILMHKIRPHTATLRKFTYGKHILAKLEKLEKYYAMKPNGMDMIFLPPSLPPGGPM